MSNPIPLGSAVQSAVRVDEKFWSRGLRINDCDEWQGYRDRQGYGKVMRDGANVLAHRYAFELLHGPIPPGTVIRHSCDNPPCIRPEHLLAGTQADNIRDRQERGRHRPGRLFGEDHPAHKLTAERAAEIRAAFPSGAEVDVWAARFGVSRKTIYDARSGRRWNEAA